MQLSPISNFLHWFFYLTTTPLQILIISKKKILNIMTNTELHFEDWPTFSMCIVSWKYIGKLKILEKNITTGTENQN